jgi:hypothetical protein
MHHSRSHDTVIRVYNDAGSIRSDSPVRPAFAKEMGLVVLRPHLGSLYQHRYCSSDRRK